MIKPDTTRTFAENVKLLVVSCWLLWPWFPLHCLSLPISNTPSRCFVPSLRHLATMDITILYPFFIRNLAVQWWSSLSLFIIDGDKTNGCCLIPITWGQHDLSISSSSRPLVFISVVFPVAFCVLSLWKPLLCTLLVLRIYNVKSILHSTFKEFFG